MEDRHLCVACAYTLSLLEYLSVSSLPLCSHVFLSSTPSQITKTKQNIFTDMGKNKGIWGLLLNKAGIVPLDESTCCYWNYNKITFFYSIESYYITFGFFCCLKAKLICTTLGHSPNHARICVFVVSLKKHKKDPSLLYVRILWCVIVFGS